MYEKNTSYRTKIVIVLCTYIKRIGKRTHPKPTCVIVTFWSLIRRDAVTRANNNNNNNNAFNETLNKSRADELE